MSRACRRFLEQVPDSVPVRAHRQNVESRIGWVSRFRSRFVGPRTGTESGIEVVLGECESVGCGDYVATFEHVGESLTKPLIIDLE